MAEVNVLVTTVDADATGVKQQLARSVDSVESGIEKMLGAIKAGGSAKVSFNRSEFAKVRRRIMAVHQPVLDALSDSIDETTSGIVQDARKRVPVDTGRLKTVIRAHDVTERGERLSSKVTAGGDSGRVNWVSSRTGAAVRGNVVAYGPAVEFGRPDMPAYPKQPFLGPASEAERRPYAERGRKRVAEAVEEALR